jgi:hypothetical protein
MRFRKSYIGALIISFAVFCVTGLIALAIVIKVPSSPLAQQMEFLRSNHFSGAVFVSSEYTQKAQQVQVFDFWITLIAMAIAGVALGFRMASRVRLLETVAYSVVSAVILSVVTLSLSWLGTIAVERSTVASNGFGPATLFDWRYVLVTTVSIILWTISYLAGGVSGHALRQRFAPSAPPKGRKPSSKTRVASTSL